MTIKHQPATPLPWTVKYSTHVQAGEYGHDVAHATLTDSTPGTPQASQNAAYIAHAANAYPKLVEALRELSAGVQRLQTVTKADQQAVALPICRALALISELGEAS